GPPPTATPASGGHLLGTLGYHQLATLGFQPSILVNATPVGMHPDADAAPVDLAAMSLPPRLVYDLVYNPSPTILMRHAAALGIPAVDGLAMLHLQADLSWDLFRRL
ncbi:MAG: hypothetical protein IJ745_01960, partial [Bacteroidales bacterium]|nr:hypothetical protein [Bacteroidales bacterium]